MRAWQRLLCALLGTSLVACVQLEPRPRGVIVPIEQLRARELRPYAADLFADGRIAEGFYVLEVAKNRGLAVVHMPRGSDGQSADRGEIVATPADAGPDGTSRGLVFVPRTLPLSAEDVSVNDAAFWAGHEINEGRATAVAMRSFPPAISLQGRTLNATLEGTQRLLMDGEAMLNFVVTEQAVFAVLVMPNAARVERIAASPAEISEASANLVAQVRDQRATGWARAGARVYELLLKPFATELAEIEDLIVVPDAFLSNLPFAVVGPIDGEPLIERTRVRYLPSASLYRAALRHEARSEAPRLLVMGNASYSKPWPPLPAAELEARTVQRVFAGSRLLVGDAATEEAFYRHHREYNVLHFATHGLIGGSAFAPVSSIVLTPGAEHDGYLGVVEIGALDLQHTQLTVLSACETSVSQSQNLDSLVAAFLHAGSPRVVGSQWQVSDDATARLMLTFYESFVAKGPGEALRFAQLELAKNPSYAHPYFWAAFVLYGASR